MRARDLASPFPILLLDADAAEVARLLAAEEVGVVFLTGAEGRLRGAVTDASLLWFLLPRYLDTDPALAGVLEEAAADVLRDRLAGRGAGDLLATAHTDIERVDGDANLIEVAEVLVRRRAPVVSVWDGDRLVGGITTSALLRRLLVD
jgi:CBS domain-containing protein